MSGDTHKIRSSCSRCWDAIVRTGAMKKNRVLGKAGLLHSKSSMPGEMPNSSESTIKWNSFEEFKCVRWSCK